MTIWSFLAFLGGLSKDRDRKKSYKNQSSQSYTKPTYSKPEEKSTPNSYSTYSIQPVQQIIKHPRCIVVGVYFPNSYKKYHYLSKEMVRIGATVVVLASGEHKKATVITCKEYDEYETLPYPYNNMRYILSSHINTHPKCIVVTVYFPGTYKKYHYLSEDMVSVGDSVIVPAAGESKTVTVAECKEYLEWETLPYSYSEMSSIISVVKKPSTTIVDENKTYLYYSKPRGHHPYYDSQMEDEYLEGVCYDQLDFNNVDVYCEEKNTNRNKINRFDSDWLVDDVLDSEETEYLDEYSHGYEYRGTHSSEIPLEKYSGIWDEENLYYDMLDYYDEDIYLGGRRK